MTVIFICTSCLHSLFILGFRGLTIDNLKSGEEWSYRDRINLSSKEKTAIQCGRVMKRRELSEIYQLNMPEREREMIKELEQFLLSKPAVTILPKDFHTLTSFLYIYLCHLDSAQHNVF